MGELVGRIPDNLLTLLPPVRRRPMPFITAGALLFAAGCKPNTLQVEQRAGQALAPSEYRRSEGTWTKEEVIALARGMIAEAGIADIARLGNVLLGNQEGQPTLSAESPLMVDGPLTFKTVPRIASPIKGAEAPASMQVGHAQPKVTTTLKPRIPGLKPYPIDTLSKLKAETVQIDRTVTEGTSDFFLKFITAKEMYNFRAFDLVTTVLAGYALSKQYELPQDNVDVMNAVKILAWTGGIANTETPFIADLWAHFLMLPAYNTAKDQGKFTKKDLDKLHIFDGATNILSKEKVFERRTDGTYKWAQMDSEDFYDIWLKTAISAKNVGIAPK